MENNVTQELIEKAKKAKTAQELLALSKENGVELSREEAEAYFDQLAKTGELSDNELASVSGGGCNYKDGRLIVTVGYRCKYWTCENCGGMEIDYRRASNDGQPPQHRCPDGHIPDFLTCNTCKYMVYEHALWLCNNPENRK